MLHKQFFKIKCVGERKKEAFNRANELVLFIFWKNVLVNKSELYFPKWHLWN